MFGGPVKNNVRTIINMKRDKQKTWTHISIKTAQPDRISSLLHHADMLTRRFMD